MLQIQYRLQLSFSFALIKNSKDEDSTQMGQWLNKRLCTRGFRAQLHGRFVKTEQGNQPVIWSSCLKKNVENKVYPSSLLLYGRIVRGQQCSCLFYEQYNEKK